MLLLILIGRCSNTGPIRLRHRVSADCTGTRTNYRRLSATEEAAGDHCDERKANDMPEHDTPPSPPDASVGLAEIMETVERIEARLRAAKPADLDDMVDLINLLRMRIVSTFAGPKV